MNQEELYAKIGLWNEAQSQLSALKEREMNLRKEIFSAIFPTPAEGTNTSELPDGWKIKGVYKLNYSLDDAALTVALKELRKHRVAVDTLVTYKPSLSVSEYKKLDPKWKQVLASAVEVKPGAPALDLIAPKSV